MHGSLVPGILIFTVRLSEQEIIAGSLCATRHYQGTNALIVKQDEDFGEQVTRCYFWFFGYVAKLPFERSFKGGYATLPVEFDFDVDVNVTPLAPQD